MVRSGHLGHGASFFLWGVHGLSYWYVCFPYYLWGVREVLPFPFSLGGLAECGVRKSENIQGNAETTGKKSPGWQISFYFWSFSGPLGVSVVRLPDPGEGRSSRIIPRNTENHGGQATRGGGFPSSVCFLSNFWLVSSSRFVFCCGVLVGCWGGGGATWDPPRGVPELPVRGGTIREPRAGGSRGRPGGDLKDTYI